MTVREVTYAAIIIRIFASFLLGGIIGSKVNKKISAATTDKLFAGLLCLIIAICIYNAYRFAG